MSAAGMSNLASQTESKNIKKKRSKGDIGTPTSEKATAAGGDAGDGAEGGSDLVFLRELQKNIRNLKKKIASTQKVDGIVAENPGVSLDDLLANKKINLDQKQQAERKPMLQASLQELEEEAERYRRVEESTGHKHEAAISALKLNHAQEIESLRDSAAQEASTAGNRQLREKLLLLSKFLRSAAAKRQDGDETAEESRAFEGALLLVYGGDASAVQAMENIVSGSDDLVPTVEGTKTTVSWKQLREAFLEGEDIVTTDAQSTDDTTHHTSTAPGQSDPTLTNAGLTELDAPTTVQIDTNRGEGSATSTAPGTGVVDSGAANAAAESSWQNMTSSITSGDDWVQVSQIPRDPSETENATRNPAAISSTQSWAEDVPTEATAAPIDPGLPPNDGFHEVHHGRTRARGSFQGEYRGRGRGGFRGDRGDGNFRGRGGFRGDRGGGDGPRGRGRGGFRGPRGGRGDSFGAS